MLAGGTGAVLRFLVDSWIQRQHSSYFPFGTFLINVFGSLLLGFFQGWFPTGFVLASLGTGFCGGFTTFSTASVEAIRLMRAKRLITALGYLGITVISCVLASYIGFQLS